MSHKKRASTAFKSMGAAGLAAATIVSGLSFGSPAVASPRPSLSTNVSPPPNGTVVPLASARSAGGAIFSADTSWNSATTLEAAVNAAARLKVERTSTADKFQLRYTSGRLSGNCATSGTQVDDYTLSAASNCSASTTWSLDALGRLVPTAKPGLYLRTEPQRGFYGGNYWGVGASGEAARLPGLNDAEFDATVVSVNNIKKSALISGTATPGMTVWVGEQNTSVRSDGSWSMTVGGLQPGENDLTAVEKLGTTEYGRKTLTATLIEGGTLVGIDQGPVELKRGENTPVPFVVENREARTDTKGTVVLTAPDGATFSEQNTVQGSWRRVGNTAWNASTSIPLTNGRLSNDNTTLTFDADWASERSADQQYRFMIDVTASGEAPEGSSAMDFVFSGTSNTNDFRAEGKTTTTIDAADVALAARVESIDHAAKTAVISGTATPGAKVSIGEQSVDADAETGAWSITVRDLDEGANEFTVTQKIGDKTIDTKDLTVTINTAAISGQNGAPVTLERDGDTSVEALFKTNDSISRPQGTVEFTAPAGTTFSAGQNTVNGAYKVPGAEWSNSGMTLSNGVRSEDGTKYTYDFKTTTSTWNLPADSLMRWNITVNTPADAEAGTGTMRTTLVGAAVEGSFNTTSSTATTIDEAVSPVAPLVVATPANGSTVSEKRPVFSGTGDEGATIQITGSTGRVVAATVVKDGKWSVPADFDLVDGSYALTAAQTPVDGEKTTAPINFVVKAMVPVTLTAPAIDADVSTPKPVFEGRGTPGATVVVKGTYGSVLATTEVKADGTWSVASSVSLAVGSYAGTATQTVDGKTTTAPFKFTVGQNLTPVTLDTPAVGAEITDTKPVFKGEGQPGATVEVKGTYGTLLATAEVKADGTWEATSSVTLANGTYAGKAWQTVSGKTTTADFRFTIAQSITPVTLESPAVGAEITDTKPVFKGEGQPGATVEVKGTYGTLLATAEVTADGTWEATSDVTLARGTYAGKAWQTVSGKTTTADFRFTIVAPMIPVSLTTPAQDAVITTSKPVFTGTGTPNADITITGASGTKLASGKVRTDGGFDLTSTVALGAGSYSGTVRQVADGKVTTDTFQFRIVFTAVTLESPAIGATLTNGTPVFSGKGTPKAPLLIKGSGGTTLAEGTVKDDGTWTLTSTKTLAPGSYTGTVLQTLPGSDTTAPFSFTVS